MAASDKPFHNQRTLDIVFAVSNILMLLSVVWMLYQDHVEHVRPAPTGLAGQGVPEVGDSLRVTETSAFALTERGECFVERFLEQARHVETQCLADDTGNVVVVSTRMCT